MIIMIFETGKTNIVLLNYEIRKNKIKKTCKYNNNKITTTTTAITILAKY